MSVYLHSVFFSRSIRGLEPVVFAIVLNLIRPVLALILLVPVMAMSSPAPEGVVSSPNSPEAFASTVLRKDANPAEKGHLVFAELDRRNSGYRDFQVGLRMVLVGTKGRQTERALRIQQLEGEDDGDKILVVFDVPASIRGTALLSHAHRARDDDQWLFLPALKRTKKIASRNKTGPFVGSEFAFEDLSPQELDKYGYLYIGAEPCGGQACFVIDRFPKDRYSGYSRQRVWLDQVHLRTLRIDYFDRAERHFKQLTVADYERYLGQYWKPAFMRMENLRNDKRTELHWLDYEFGLGLDEDRDFSVNSLRRAR